MKAAVSRTLETLEQIILGKPHEVRLAFACLLARGHLLIEDVPGVGKTTLALALSRVMGLQFQRIQFTADLLPADVLGVSVFEAATNGFRFHPGPVFSQVILADEINRASPKTQSALLEAMEERQVSIEGQTRALPDPFFVVATQNPLSQLGVFPLPESQLDRFLMRISMGYPPAAAERALLAEADDRRGILARQPAVLDTAQLQALQTAVSQIVTRPALLDYILTLVQATRDHRGLRHGVSPRAGLALKRAAQAWAFVMGRPGVLPEDVQAVFPAVMDHRLLAANTAEISPPTAMSLLAAVAIP